MEIMKKGISFYCGALVWFISAIICFTSSVPIFKPENNIFWGCLSLLASIIFFINGYKANKQT
ncbi:hypothetical protein [Paraclostridium tenue]|uniref:Uncharacterized protein n=1 Tax=Paraclostridium tenue TaxID=1737 RepID=A0ABP3XE56_9FIRM